MNLPYVIPRVIRHFLPDSVARFLLLRSWVIKPGLETADSQAATKRYGDALAEANWTLKGKRVLVFGYGGRFDVGVQLLAAGAAYVCLCDRYAPPDDEHNAQLVEEYGDYVKSERGKPRPRPEFMGLLEGDVSPLGDRAAGQEYDLVVSNSVYEHLQDVGVVTQALARLTKRHGRHVHFVDLRDHFFQYPFEMLSYSDRTWNRWLNPGSNHNRLRVWDYRSIFEAAFDRVDVSVLGRDEAAFKKNEHRIRSEFKSGDIREDSVTLVRILAEGPKR